MLEYKQAVRLTDRSVWQTLSDAQKKGVLQTLENHIAESEGRTARNVVLEEMDVGYFGYYDHSDPANLHLSFSSIADADDAVDTLFHEGRHAYQHDCIDNGSGFPEPTLKQFQDGFDNYVEPEKDIEAYERNFCERDARDFAQLQCKLLSIEREAYLNEDMKAGIDEIYVPTAEEMGVDSSFYAEKQQFDANMAQASVNPKLARWLNEPCSWQPEREKVKTYGGYDTVDKVYTNGEVYKAAMNQWGTDVARAEAQKPYIEDPKQKDALNTCLKNEGIALKNMTKSMGNDELFRENIDRFRDASALVQEYLPNQINYGTENYSVGRQNAVNGQERSVPGAESDETRQPEQQNKQEAFASEQKSNTVSEPKQETGNEQSTGQADFWDRFRHVNESEDNGTRENLSQNMPGRGTDANEGAEAAPEKEQNQQKAYEEAAPESTESENRGNLYTPEAWQNGAGGKTETDGEDHAKEQETRREAEETAPEKPEVEEVAPEKRETEEVAPEEKAVGENHNAVEENAPVEPGVWSTVPRSVPSESRDNGEGEGQIQRNGMSM